MLFGSTHDQMEVICPWYPDNYIGHRRFSELKEHAGGVHREILKGLPPDLLSDGNAYYVSQYPNAH